MKTFYEIEAVDSAYEILELFVQAYNEKQEYRHRLDMIQDILNGRENFCDSCKED